jgi:hypothetical protein
MCPFVCDDSSPLVSVVIPTRGRVEYAAIAISDVLDAAGNETEVVVEDNNETPGQLSHLLNHRRRILLSYRHESRPRSLSDNFEQAVGRARGRYICVIGDDDTIMSDFEAAANWARRRRLDAVLGSLRHEYVWPSRPTGIEGRLVSPGHDGAMRNLDVGNAVTRLLTGGGTRYHRYDLPRLYHGIVSRAALLQCRKRAGRFFKPLSPDIYAAVGLSRVVRAAVRVNWPLTLPGASPNSGTVLEGKRRAFGGPLDAAPQTRLETNYIPTHLVPPVYCLDAVWADTAARAVLDHYGEEELRHFNIVQLAAWIVHQNPELMGAVRNHYYNTALPGSDSTIPFRFALLAAIVRGPAREMARRVACYALDRLGKYRRLDVTGVPTIGAARNLLEESLCPDLRKAIFAV